MGAMGLPQLEELALAFDLERHTVPTYGEDGCAVYVISYVHRLAVHNGRRAIARVDDSHKPEIGLWALPKRDAGGLPVGSIRPGRCGRDSGGRAG